MIDPCVLAGVDAQVTKQQLDNQSTDESDDRMEGNLSWPDRPQIPGPTHLSQFLAASARGSLFASADG